MTAYEFDTQINRLKDVFGDRHYPDERVKLLWRAVSDYPGKWFSKTVDKFIGECRQPPLLPEFRTEVAIERERSWGKEKEVHAKDAKQFMQRFDDQIRSSICKTIRDRIQGKVDDETYTNFVDGITRLAEQR